MAKGKESTFQWYFNSCEQLTDLNRTGIAKL